MGVGIVVKYTLLVIFEIRAFAHGDFEFGIFGVIAIAVTLVLDLTDGHLWRWPQAEIEHGRNISRTMKLNHRKWNTESTIGQRLRLLIGAAMAIAGLTMLLWGNFSGDGMHAWLIGLGLFIGGLLVVKSLALLMSIAGLR